MRKLRLRTCSQVFSARRCAKLGDEALAELLRAGSVTHLCLSGVAGVGPAVADALAACCRESLEELDVSFCRCVRGLRRTVCVSVCEGARM